jgi:D-alanyl-D-alanine dipeptidase
MKNKIMKEGLKLVVFIGIYIPAFYSVSAQNIPLNSYGLPVINSVSLYQRSLVTHPEKKMISLADIPGIIFDLRYSSMNNFMHKNLYPKNIKTTFLRKRVCQALDSVAIALSCKGLILVIFDAYRPYSVTEALWIQVKDERYAADPAKGSRHNRGIAVDLTLADAKTQELIPMPTGFDNFSDTAHQGFMGTDATRIANREILKQAMKNYGFVPLPTEWWHFSWPNPEEFELLDLSFEQLNALQ